MALIESVEYTQCRVTELNEESSCGFHASETLLNGCATTINFRFQLSAYIIVSVESLLLHESPVLLALKQTQWDQSSDAKEFVLDELSCDAVLLIDSRNCNIYHRCYMIRSSVCVGVAAVYRATVSMQPAALIYFLKAHSLKMKYFETRAVCLDLFNFY